MHWNQGYVSEIDYLYGYYSELNPLQTKLKLIYAGIKPLEVQTACELGFGQGVSLLCNAASSSIDWYGNDFNPNQVAFVNEAIDASDLSLRVSDQSFEEYCARTDLPQFDFIALHGIWSWISESNRKIISQFIADKLKVGGVLYISYNTEPGRTAMRPFRELMQWYSKSFTSPDKLLTDKISDSMKFMDELLSVSPAFKKAYPHVERILNEISSKNKQYLAHEYFNADWEPMSIKRVSDVLADCKLQFAASAHPIDQIPNINFTKDQLELMQPINDPILKESIKDFCINQDFRRDLWVKGGRRLSTRERIKELLSISVTLVSPIKDITFELKTPSGNASLDKNIYQPVLNCLEGKSSIRLSQLAHDLKGKLDLTQLMDVCLVLAGKGNLCVALEDKTSEKIKVKTQKLNNFFMDRAEFDQNINVLVSPVTSAAVAVNRFEQFFIKGYEEKYTKSIDLAQFVWRKLKAQGQKIVSNDKVLQSEEDNLKYLTILADGFIENKLPELIRLKIV